MKSLNCAFKASDGPHWHRMEVTEDLMNIPAANERVTRQLSSNLLHELAAQSGFALAGVTTPFPVEGVASAPDFTRFRNWTDRGLAGEMRYLTDHRADVRSDPGQLLPGVKSVICVGMAYNGPKPYSTEFNDLEKAWISRYAWGDDYHVLMRNRLEQFASRMLAHSDFEWRACVDTAPLLERSYARRAGLGWIGKNTCLINERHGSWFFLGELLTTLELRPDHAPPDRCGTCSRCIDACPTEAIAPSPLGGWELDARRCISYFTIELRGTIPEQYRASTGANIFGCDICQDVCPWNRPGRAALTEEQGFRGKNFAPSLERLAVISQEEFRRLFRSTPVSRAKYSGFLRNVAIAMGNSGLPKFRDPLEKLAMSDDALVAEHALWALTQLA